jgi:phage shock protein C
MDNVRASFARNGLVRSTDRGILGGVCAGIGRRAGLGPWVSRLLFLVLLMVLPGSQFLVYPVLWFLMPSDDSTVALANRPHTTR